MNTPLIDANNIPEKANKSCNILIFSGSTGGISGQHYKTAVKWEAAMGDCAIITKAWRLQLSRLRPRIISTVLGSAAVLAAFAGLAAAPAKAQVIARGDMAVSGFSGTALPQGGLLPGANPADQVAIDGAGPALRIFDASNFQGPPAGAIIAPPLKLEVKAEQTGQVFGLAFDDGQTPGLFAGATSFYGVQITGPGGERLAAGAPGARFMDNQWGAALGGGPGSVWRIDGGTGEVKLFANITLNGQPNSGPGLGDVAFDARTRSLYVSDLDTGMIHRIAGSGADTARFDHGVAGRPAKGRPPMPDDGRRMDIASPAFIPAEPQSWGMTPEGRRVLALAAHEGRLFYSVAEGGQIWSVGLAPDGGFLADARLEAEAPVEAGSAITDIAFDGGGRLYAAQRGKPLAARDYSQFAEPEKAQVFRFVPGPGGLVPDSEDYPVGLRDPNRMSAGGLSLSPAYDARGRIAPRSCGRALAVTGDHLTDTGPGRIDPAAPGAVHGVQLTADVDAPRVRPPLNTWFTHYNEAQDDPNFAGHVGDVEILQRCDDLAAAPGSELFPAPPPVAPLPAPSFEPGEFPLPLGPFEPQPPLIPDSGANLSVTKVGGPCVRAPGAAIQCAFTITVINSGPDVFEDIIVLNDTMGFNRTNATFSAPWACVGGPADFTCSHPVVALPPGGSVSMEVLTNISHGDISSSPCELANTVSIAAPLAGAPGNLFGEDDIASGTGIFPPGTNCLPVPPIDPQAAQTNLSIAKTGDRCLRRFFTLQCRFTITVTNAGTTPFSGPLTVSETLGTGLGDTSFSAPWTCAGGPAAFTCNHPAVTLAPGQSLPLEVRTLLTPTDIAATPCELPNSAAIVAPAAGTQGNGLPGDDSATATLTLPSANCKKPANLRILKRVSAGCAKSPFFKGYKCSFDLLILNTGSDPFTGPISFVDEGTFASEVTVSAPWKCDKEATVARDRVCRHPGITIPANGSVILPALDAFVPFTEVPPTTPAAGCRLTNTVRLTVPLGGTAGNENPDDDISSATTPFPQQPNEGKAVPCDPPSLKIEKTSAGPCMKSGNGWDCAFAIKVTSTGPDPFQEAPIEIDEILPPGAFLKSVSAPWKCAGVGGTAHCVHPKTTLAVGQSVTMDVTVSIADSAVPPGMCRMSNIARLTTAAGQDDVTAPQFTANASSAIPSPKCLRRPASPQLPLTIAKTGDSECQGGQACRFTLTVSNPGSEPFSGPVTIADGLSLSGGASVTDARLVSVTPSLGCAQQPSALPFNCTAQMTLAAGESRVYTVSIMLPEQAGAAGYGMRNCAVIADPSLPDRLRALQAEGRGAASATSMPSGGNGAGGSYSCHDFRVEPTPAGCQGGLILNNAGRCVCPQGTSWNGRRCAPPITQPPTVQCPPYTTGRYPDCRPIPCPPNTTGRYPDCRPMECPRGTYGQYPDCKREETQTPECPPYTRGRYPDCRPLPCPPGSYGRYPDCRRVQTPPCPEGTFGRYPNCKPIPCPAGTYGRYPDCRKEQTPPCPQGTTGRYPDCRPIECPPGTYGRYPDCKRDRPCPQGTTGRYPDCKPIECPPGTYGRYPDCKRDRPCPQGTTGRYPDCKPIECPPGTYGRYPDCKRDRPCPQGTTGRYPDCRPIACPPGTTGRPPRCAPIRCPEGMEGSPPNCRPVRRPCPPGTFGRFPYCRPKVDTTPQPGPDRRCPPGTFGRKPYCRPIQTGPAPQPQPQPQPQPDWNRYRCPPGYIGRRPYCRRVNPQPQGPIVR
jgi:hypothetical protein